MDPVLRQAFNEQFTEEKYRVLQERVNEGWVQPASFRIAETPLFITDDFRQRLVRAGEDIIRTILRPDFKELTERAVPDRWRIPNENDHPHFLAFDFALSRDAAGELTPKLIEIQGFPSLYGFQVHIAEMYQECYDLPSGLDFFYNGVDKEGYIDLLRRTILGPCKPEEVVLMDVDVYNQKTNIDFFITQHYLGIPIVSLEDLIKRGRQLYYRVGDRELPIRRIYNRLIFDELDQNPELQEKVIDVREDLDVEWITHPAWFYRISKFTMPWLEGDFVPKTRFLHELNEVPQDLENYVLKPLFSFAGQGVIIDVKPEDIQAIPDPENWILQEKVEYVPAVHTPDGDVKAEIRLLYLWPDGDDRPTLTNNLVRLSKGKMIGVRYNKEFTWVGSSASFFRKENNLQ